MNKSADGQKSSSSFQGVQDTVKTRRPNDSSSPRGPRTTRTTYFTVSLPPAALTRPPRRAAPLWRAESQAAPVVRSSSAMS